MTRTRKTISSLLALVLAVCFALSTFVVSMAADDSVSHELKVAQIIEGTAKPETVTGNYAIIPDKAEYPMPVGKDGNTMEVFTLIGNALKEGTFTFTEPGTYQYTAGKLKAGAKAPYSASDFEEGTKVKPLTHVFGYKVERAADGSLTVIPFTCEDPTISLFADGTGMTIYNYLKVDAPEEPSTEKPEPSTEKPEPSTDKPEPSTDKPEPSTDKPEPSTEPTTQPTSVKPVTNKNNEPVTNSNGTIKTTIVYKNGGTTVVYRNGTTTVKGGRVNTGDESHLILWVTILGVAAAGLIILILARRRHDDDDEETL